MSRPFIGTRQTQLRLSGEEANRAWIQRQLLSKGEPLVQDWTPKGKIEARIHYGEWQVVCPAGCNGAEVGDPDWPVFVCTECGHGPLDVVFPKNRETIEALIIARPLQKNRHWETHETVKDLQRENKENGL